ncbi:MAG TPA: protein kinase [Polyangiaceae bacterium]|nr:protein kinase [Polyangiaceae bacterium]
MKCEACEHENMDGARFCAGCGALLPTEHTGEDPMVGQLIGGRYRITGVLGEGGMGIVYVGEQQMGSTVRKVAIKTLHQHLSKDASVLARFHRECGTVAQLEHPNTIKFYDFGATEDGTLYIAMEFVEGKPLADIIQASGALPPDRVVHIMRQVAGALDEAHEQKIIHRDLKPENIILGKRAGESDFVKVLDFGIAARTESADRVKEQKLTQQGMVLGTPPYMSPEQFTGKALDRRSDIYSLGVMAYEMLTGQLPFEADTPWQWATEHMTAQPRPFEAVATGGSIPSAMRAAIMKALAKDPEQRQATARQFFEELTEGGRVTVDSGPGASPGGSTATAAMAAAPDFAAQNYAPQNYAPVQPAMPPPVVAAASPPMATRSQSSGGGKGLVIGLGAVGAILLIAIVVVAARSMSSEEDIAPIEPIVPNPSVAQGPAVELDAEVSAETDSTPTADTGSPTGPATPPQPTKPSSQSATTSPKPSQPVQSSTTTGAAPVANTTTGSPPASGGGGGACDACVAAARAGNIPGAASSFRSCSDPKGQQDCKLIAMSRATRAAEAAANSGDCARAQAIAAAAAQMGAASGRLNKAVAKCK